MTVERIEETHSSGCYSYVFLAPATCREGKKGQRDKRRQTRLGLKSLQPHLARAKKCGHIIYHEKHGYF